MRYFTLLAIGALLLTGCSGAKETTDKKALPEKMQLGWMQRGDFISPDYPNFKQSYDTIHIADNFVEMIKTLHSGIDFVVVLGTWCSDSKREVPRFLKIVDGSLIPTGQIRFYGVDRTEKSSDGITDRYNIERVPTFIFLKHGEEVGRIVESPKNSLEEDMLTILADAQDK